VTTSQGRIIRYPILPVTFISLNHGDYRKTIFTELNISQGSKISKLMIFTRILTIICRSLESPVDFERQAGVG
jgi:hypothetical protein